VRETLSYDTEAGTSAPDGSRSRKVLGSMVAWFIDSLKLALTLVAAGTASASGAGRRPVTVGGVVSGAVVVSNTTSTQ
jgi:hypothetical protein